MLLNYHIGRFVLGISVSVNLKCLVVCVWCDMLFRFVVVGRCIFVDIDRYLLCFVIIVFSCVLYVSLVDW